MDPRQMTALELIALLRKAASVWFRNTDMMAQEELIRRFLAFYHKSEEEQKADQERYDGRSNGV